jgi:hypothetical protein
MTRTIRTRQRGPGMLAVGALVLALALAACGGRTGAPGSGATIPNTQQSAGPTVSGSSSGSAASGSSDVQSADQQIQSALQGLDSAQSDANQDFSSQDTESQP